MNLHLAEIAKAVAPNAHAVLLVDQAGWHLSTRLVVPANITIIPLPPKCPELNPVENVWQFLRDNRLSNRVFKRMARPSARVLAFCPFQSAATYPASRQSPEPRWRFAQPDPHNPIDLGGHLNTKDSRLPFDC